MIVLLALTLGPVNLAKAEEPYIGVVANTEIVMTPVPCPDNKLCNVIHIIYIKKNGETVINKDIPINYMVSNLLIHFKGPKGSLIMWSDR